MYLVSSISMIIFFLTLTFFKKSDRLLFIRFIFDRIPFLKSVISRFMTINKFKNIIYKQIDKSQVFYLFLITGFFIIPNNI